MNGNVKWIKAAKDDFNNLPTKKLKIECARFLKRIGNNPNYGQPLGNKNGRDLTGCFKIYFDEARYRIVYRKVKDSIEIRGITRFSETAEVLGIGERDGEYIYKLVASRLNL